MPVKTDASGRRSVQAEVEVPGTPEEVWEAIASGPGISSWFVPTRVDGRVGGTTTSDFGPGMESVATITAWDPPRRFSAESDELEPGQRPVATEWIVEARSGDVCVVRVVHSWFASSDDWDNQFEGHEQGWAAFFRILRQYLTHFPGQTGAAFQVMGVTQGPVSRAWEALSEQLGLVSAEVGQPVRSRAGAPVVAGAVEQVGPPQHPELLIRLEQPAPGLAHLFAMSMGGQIYLPIRFYLYGEQAAATVAREEPVWQAWMGERFAPEGGAETPA